MHSFQTLFLFLFQISLSEPWILQPFSWVKMSLGLRPLHAPFQLGRAETDAITKCLASPLIN